MRLCFERAPLAFNIETTVVLLARTCTCHGKKPCPTAPRPLDCCQSPKTLPPGIAYTPQPPDLADAWREEGTHARTGWRGGRGNRRR
eukprot:3280803-Rhodomonas_salina.4